MADPVPRPDFASDNTAGICPEALSALLAANAGRMASYGNDELTRQACDRIRALFDTDCDVFFVFNGTAANALALATLCQSYHGIVCHELAHVETDECGAPEFFSNGTKLLPVGGAGGKIEPAALEAVVTRRSDLHFPKPKAVTISQATELGTVYRLEELRALGEAAHRLGLRLHMDGARFANALVALGAAPAELTWRAGVDVLSLGGTKLGMPVGEAVVFFDRELAADFPWRCKQAGQLASKMRFLAAPWLGVLNDDAWLRHAAHANAMALRLAQGLRALPGVSLMQPVEANAVFVLLPPEALVTLRSAGWMFYTFIGLGGARFVCAWDTTETQVDDLIAAVGAALLSG
jgi:threonine aldolase